MYEDAIRELEAGATLATVNRRLARALSLAHGAAQAAAGRFVWETPEVLSWSAWVQRTLAALAERDGRYAVLSEEQALALWEEIVAGSGAGQGLLQSAPTARAAYEAWRTLHEWEVPLSALEGGVSEDVRAFAEWAREYQRRCAAGGWGDPAAELRRLAERMRAGDLQVPARLCLAGFDELTPAQATLLEALRSRGCEAVELEPRLAPGRARRVCFPDAKAEIEAAARWARGLIERGATGPIGIVAPDLGALRTALARGLDRVLLPGAVLPGTPDGERPWNLSLGPPLAEQPPVHTALLMLELASGELPLAQAGLLLRSPYLRGAQREAEARALLDARLRETAAPTVPLGRLRYLAGTEGAPYHCPLLAGALRALEGGRAELRRRRPAGDWAPLAAGILQGFGWPGERGLSSAEYQAVEAWRDLLHDYTGLDPVVAPCGFDAARARIARLARGRAFQPEGGDAAVQVLGVLEAAGQRFAHLWILGLHDEAWPAPARPTPFLPLALQRRVGLPHGSAARELGFARRATARLLGSSAEVVASYPAMDGERALRPSPLITDLPEGAAEDLGLDPVPSYWQVLHAAAALEPFEDFRAPAIAAGEEAAGGTGVFRDQSACPFQAFARHRLHARPLGEAVPGLDAAGRGSLVHAVLCQVWGALGSQAQLLAWDPERLSAVIDEAAAAVVAEEQRRRPGVLGPRFAGLERRRLARLALAWLELERERAPFEVVARESAQRLSLGGVAVSTRIDRIDRLADGRRVVIDYKTGRQASYRAWFGERPEEPQLPVYVSGEKDLAAVAFAQVRPGECAWSGLAAGPGLIPGVKAGTEVPEAEGCTDWDALLQTWRVTLERLAQAFRAGDARVDPRNAQVCQYCELGLLCRINELGGDGTPRGEGDGQD